VSLLEETRTGYMIIGGYALPFYGRIRTTLDIDIAVAAPTEEKLRSLFENAERREYSISLGSFKNPVHIFHDKVTNYEIEVWSRPDGIVWDEKTLERRRRVTLDGLRVWIVSPEDFIVSKLAKPDRGVSDEQDVKSVMERNGVCIDWDYLEERAEKAGVWALLKMIRNI
jgi:predicted nucleotidyltransferase